MSLSMTVLLAPPGGSSTRDSCYEHVEKQTVVRFTDFIHILSFIFVL